jgi:quercetin dioxygenase-like cupin family protein
MAQEKEDGPEERLRPHPSERFAGTSRAFDLEEVLRELRAEPHPGKDGHRQITLFQRPPVTQVLFSFTAGGELREHSAPGLVTIHVLEGRLEVHADGEDHSLPGGNMLVLNPGVPHDVRAPETSAMLLTVHLEPKR